MRSRLALYFCPVTVSFKTDVMSSECFSILGIHVRATFKVYKVPRSNAKILSITSRPSSNITLSFFHISQPSTQLPSLAKMSNHSWTLVNIDKVCGARSFTHPDVILFGNSDYLVHLLRRHPWTTKAFSDGQIAEAKTKATAKSRK